MLDYVLIEDNIISPEDCDKIVNSFVKKVDKTLVNGCNFYYIKENEYFKLDFIFPKILNCYEKYVEKFKELNHLYGNLKITEFRFKYFQPNNNFNHWHWEHSFRDPYRVLGVTIYLSENKCGTEFFNKDVIETKKGRLTIFPCSFTHTHRGQICPENKDRFLLTGYFITIPHC
jgi:hypothetical protein